MDNEYRSQLEERLRVLRRLQHADKMTEAKSGINADPSLVIRIEDRAKEIVQIEAELGIERPAAQQAPPAYRRIEPLPTPIFRERVVSQHTRQRQDDIEHQINLLGIHRRTLAHFRAQAKAYGGVDFAPPMTRNGMNEARVEISRIKVILRGYGEQVDDLAGDE